MKTTKQWLNVLIALNPKLAKKVKHNIKNYPSIMRGEKYTKITHFIVFSFKWAETPEGEVFWAKIHDEFSKIQNID